MKEFIIKRRGFKFEAAHRLHNLDYESPCKSLHGHSYKVNLTISVKRLDFNGMVIDFSKLKTFQKWLDEKIDHSIILSKDDKELIKLFNNSKQKICIFDRFISTAEMMAELFYSKIYKEIRKHIDYKNMNYIEVEVFETEKNSAMYRETF